MESTLFGVLLGLPLYKMSNVKQCETPIVTWLIVEAGVHFFALIKHICVLIAVCTARNGKKVKSNIEGIYCCLFFNFEVAWLVYGNTFHYSDEGIRCKNLNDDSTSLWTLMMVIIAFGYVLFLIYFLMCCVFSCVLCCFCMSGRRNANIENPLVDKIPYMAAVKSLNKKQFGTVKDEYQKKMDECVICMQKY